MVVAAKKNKTSHRLAKYSAAAVAAAATGITASDVQGDLVTKAVSLTSTGSVELFLNIQGFALGASTFSYSFASSVASAGTPLGGTATDIMLRGAFATSTGTAQVRGNNGAGFAIVAQYVGGPYNTGTFAYALNVGSAFVTPNGTAGTYFGFGAPGAGAPTYNAFLTWPWNQGAGQFGNPGSGVAYFTFTNDLTGTTHEGWLSISIGNDGAGGLTSTITAIHVNTVPEPASGMALLCMGAAGLATYRSSQERLVATRHKQPFWSS